MTDADPLAPHGWCSSFPDFERAPARVVRARLQDFIPDASPQQLRAWDDSIPKLHTEVREAIEGESDAGQYTAILECELPLDVLQREVRVSDATSREFTARSQRTRRIVDPAPGRYINASTPPCGGE